MKLYYSPGACSMAPHILLHELNEKFDLEKVDLGAHKTEGGADFYQVNRKGYVPTLEMSDKGTLTEVSTILQFLADKAKAKNLLPEAGTMQRYRAMEMLNFIASELHKGIGGLFNKAMPEEGRKLIIDKVSSRLNYVDQLLTERKFMMGNDFSVADAYAFTVLGWGKLTGIDMGKWKNISRYMDEVAKRPSVQHAMKAEGLVAA